MCGRGRVCGGANMIVCVCVCVSMCLCVCRNRGRGDIHFGKAQQLCVPPSMFGLLLCIFMEG